MSPDSERLSKPEQPKMDVSGESFIRSPSPAPAIEVSSGRRSPYSVELHIESLTLHGLEIADRHRVGDALERELARLFTERGVPTFLAQDNIAATVATKEFRVAEGSTPESIGAQVALAIFMGMY